MENKLHISKIGQIAVRVHDLDKAVEFYQKMLDLPLLFRAPNLAFFNCGNVRLMLGKPESAHDDHPASVIYYQVDDIEAAYQTLKQRNVNFIDQPHLVAEMEDHDLWMVFFHDLDENMLALMCEKKR